MNPIKEDMNMILLELMDKTIDINKINIATELTIEKIEKRKRKQI